MQLEECQRALLDYQLDDDVMGGYSDNVSVDERLLLLKCITKYCTDFNQCIQGGSSLSSFGNSPSALHMNLQLVDGLTGGARLYSLFHDKFAKMITRLDPLTNLTETDIYLAIKNSSGLRPSLFLPEQSFEILVKSQISLLLEPCLLFLDEIYSEILSLLRLCADLPSSSTSLGSSFGNLGNLPFSRKSLLSKYPLLRESLVKHAESLLQERMVPMRQMVHQFIGIESAYINTNHPDFIKASTAIHHLSKYYEAKKSLGQHNVPLSSSNLSSLSAGQAMGQPRTTTPSSASAKETSASPTLGTTATRKNSLSSDFSRINISDPSSNGTNTTNTGILNYFFRGQNVTPANTPQLSQASVTNLSLPGSLPSAHSKKPSSAFFPGSGHIARRSVNSPASVPSEETVLNPASLTAIGHAHGSLTGSLSDKDEMEVQIILTLLHSYFSIVKNNVIDFIPKSILYFILQYLMDNMQNLLVSSIYHPATSGKGLPESANDLSFLLKEDESLKQEKAALQSLMKAYQDAKWILNQVSSDII